MMKNKILYGIFTLGLVLTSCEQPSKNQKSPREGENPAIRQEKAEVEDDSLILRQLWSDSDFIYIKSARFRSLEDA